MTKIMTEQIREVAERMCEGDNNGIAFLDAEYSDWVEVDLDKETISIDMDSNQLTIQGRIISMNYWYDESIGRNVSDWGSGFEFDLKDFDHDKDTKTIENISGTWVFEITKNKFDAIELREIDCWD